MHLTLAASAGPMLVTVMVYVNVPPTWTGLGAPTLVIDRVVLVVVVADAVAGATGMLVLGTKALAVAVLTICPAAMSPR